MTYFIATMHVMNRVQNVTYAITGFPYKQALTLS